jgi:ATP adenylyltransferase
VERLWSPWRLDYVTRAASPDSDACVFCAALDPAGGSPLVVCRGDRAFVILNKYPYNNGHLMVVPMRHVARLADATAAELTELITLTRVAEMALTESYAAHGINVGMNLGRPAGAGVVGHLHVHLVPRWDGDTNFMTVVGDTRVVPEEPAASVARLKPVFERLAAAPLAIGMRHAT